MLPILRRRLALAAALRRLRTGHLSSLLIHAHMRSGSSLVLHLLCSHDAIAGYGETHRSYRSLRDVAKLVLDVEEKLGAAIPERCRYVVDKLLHEYRVEPEALATGAHTPRHVFMIREPRPAIASMLDEGFAIITSQDEAERYYGDQLDLLRERVRRVDSSGQPRAFLTYEELTEHAEATLARMSRFLELDTELTPFYQTLTVTGVEGFGDSSDSIRAGRVLKRTGDKSMNLERPVDVGLERAHRSFVHDMREGR